MKLTSIAFPLIATAAAFVEAQTTSSAMEPSPSAPTMNNTLMAMVQVEGNVSATISFVYVPGVGVTVQGTNLTGFTNTSEGARYQWHIHETPVAEFDGNTTRAGSVARCAAARSHHDPLNVTEAVICSPNATNTHQYCQTGDVSGKHGAINGTENGMALDFEYSDPYLRFFPQPFSLLGRSVVIHGYNKTRLGCGNVISMVDGSDMGNSTYQDNYLPAQRPPTASASLASGTAINTAGLSAINYTLANPAPAVSTAPNVVLATSDGRPIALPATSSFEYSAGAALPTQALRMRRRGRWA